MGLVPAGGTGVLGRLTFGEGTGVESDQGVDPRSAEGLSVGRPSTIRERESIASRSVSILSTSALTNSGLSA